MSPDHIPHDVIEALKALASALAPAAIGSAVAQAWEKGLSLRDRLIQWVVGICVSYYVTLVAAAVFDFNDFVAQGVGFVVAMIAFKSTPRFIAASGDAVAALPGVVLGWLPTKRPGSVGDNPSTDRARPAPVEGDDA